MSEAIYLLNWQLVGMERMQPTNRYHRAIENEENKTGLKGFEPLTYRLRVCRSTELSYKPAKCLNIVVYPLD